MSYYARAANQWTAWRDIEIGRVNDEIARVDQALTELDQEYQDASEPDNAQALREALAKWTTARDESQGKFDALVTEIQQLNDNIPTQDALDTAEAAFMDLRTPYMALYDQWENETDPTARQQLEEQMAEQRPALDAATQAFQTLQNQKIQNEGRIPGKERARDAEEIRLNSYKREVQKFTNRLAQPSERRPGIQGQIDYFNERKTELQTKIAGINTKYGKYAANIVVGRLFNVNSRTAASDAVNAAVFEAGRRGGATIGQIEDSLMDSEDMVDEPPMNLSIQGWPAGRGRFSERRAVRRARQYIRRVGGLLAGAPHWTLDQLLIHLNQNGYLGRYVRSAGITEEIYTREADIIQDRVENIVQTERARLDALENDEDENDS